MKITALVSILVLAASLPAAAAPPPFRLQDQEAAARALCGAVERATAVDTLIGDPLTVTGFISADKATFWIELLSVTYTENGTPKQMIVFGGHELEDGEISSGENSRTRVSAGVLEFRTGGWKMATRGAGIAETGFNGRDPEVWLHKIGENRHALEVTQGLSDHGSGMTTITLFEPSGAGFRQLLTLATAADDCGSKEPCFTFKGSLVYDPKSNPAALDLRLLIKGTYRNAAGTIVRVPAEPLVFKFAQGAYAPVLGNAAVSELWAALKSPW